MAKKKTRAFSYAWKLDDGLCFWADPNKNRLRLEGKPSPEAKLVRVELVEVARKKKASAK